VEDEIQADLTNFEVFKKYVRSRIALKYNGKFLKEAEI